jgi:hypothetical protein
VRGAMETTTCAGSLRGWGPMTRRRHSVILTMPSSVSDTIGETLLVSRGSSPAVPLMCRQPGSHPF